MALHRASQLPFDHLLSELIAYPLASEAAFTNPVTHLDPSMSAPTASLWRSAESDLLSSAPGISLDELIAMRDLCWFGGGGNGVLSLQDQLRATTNELLTASGGGVRLHRPAPPTSPYSISPGNGHHRQSWRWRSLALPTDLLLAVVGTADWLPHLDFFSPSVRHLLRAGFAETHLHVGASLSFPAVWAMTMARVADPAAEIRDLRAPGAVASEGQDLMGRLVRAALGRTVLSGFRACGERGSLADYLHGERFRGRIMRAAGATTFSLILTALQELASGVFAEAAIAPLRAALSALSGPPARSRPLDLAAVHDLDPVESWLPRGSGGTAEQRFVGEMCRYLDLRARGGQPDDLAARLFWQTVRVRTQFYRHLTQRPLTPGLAWFIRFYSRMSAVRGSVDPRLMVAAARDTSGTDLGLASLEMRTSPERDVDEIRSWIKAVTERAARDPEPKLALVFHFVKYRGGGAEKGRPAALGAGGEADPAGNPTGRRYGRFFTGQQATAMSLAKVLQRWPRTQFVVRALDICSDELAVPTWVLRPLVRHVRQAAGDGSRYLRYRGEAEPPPLQTTVHVGEDFTHLLTGLRNIDDAVQLLDLGEGDRLGHAVALGVDPAVWAAKAGRIAMPVEDRVLDLAWEWGWWTRRGSGCDAARLAYIERQVKDLTHRWFAETLGPLDVLHLQADLADEDKLRAAGFPNSSAPAPRADGQGRLVRYLQDSQLFRRGRTAIWVEAAEEVEAAARLQEGVRAEVAGRSLAIEINPTSNLLIGDLGDLVRHPLWRLRPPRPRADLPPLAITVGSDDPLVFDSRLPEEYQLLLDALVMAGLTDSEAMSWLDGVRRTGMERQFAVEAGQVQEVFGLTNPRPPEPPAL
ncbi:hypothetical protein Ade02nite_31700 [Paractinoplanes deccanensis]|uniref:Adenosine deaminase n=1 Tax=Paractinoplanes deccanensis TaxID=113561 RepID=A0ABQ3Y3F8_9ACTN|nr:hypothetical protein [Actinoplanes deccanensis]GID74529.1 hypothetical protein Ade02nite_31700 [Actinoplanes deccanensis]